MEQANTYKYLSIFLAIIAIIFAVLYFTKPSQPVSETFGDISADFQECRTEITAWQQANSGQVAVTTEAREQLNDILENCKDTSEDSSDKL